jgi:hypothetical protein
METRDRWQIYKVKQLTPFVVITGTRKQENPKTKLSFGKVIGQQSVGKSH